MQDNVSNVYPSLVGAEIFKCEVGVLSFIIIKYFLEASTNTTTQNAKRISRDRVLMNLIQSLKPGRRTRCHRSQGMLTRWRRPWAHTKALAYTSDVWAAIADRRWLRGRRDSLLGGNIFYWIQIICNSNRLIYNSQCLSNAPTIHVKYNYCHLVLIDAYAILSGIPPPDLDLGKKSTRDDFWCSSSQSMTNESVPPHPGNNSSVKTPAV